MSSALLYSFVLAQVFGLFLIIMSIIMAARHVFYREMLRRMDPFNPAIPFSASVGLILGLFLVVVHNIWVWDPRLIITLLSWFVLLKSILWLALPLRTLVVVKKLYSGPGYFIMAALAFIVGAFLLIKGFYLFIPADYMGVPFVDSY